MTWFKIDDSFDENPKVGRLSDAEFRLYVSALCFCSRNLTDGVVPDFMCKRLAPDADPQMLVEAGLFVTDTSHRDAFVIHDYLTHNRSRAQIEAERAAAAKRQRDSRERRKQAKKDRMSRRDGTATHTSVTQPESESESESYVNSQRPEHAFYASAGN